MKAHKKEKHPKSKFKVGDLIKDLLLNYNICLIIKIYPINHTYNKQNFFYTYTYSILTPFGIKELSEQIVVKDFILLRK